MRSGSWAIGCKELRPWQRLSLANPFLPARCQEVNVRQNDKSFLQSPINAYSHATAWRSKCHREWQTFPRVPCKCLFVCNCLAHAKLRPRETKPTQPPTRKRDAEHPAKATPGGGDAHSLGWSPAHPASIHCPETGIHTIERRHVATDPKACPAILMNAINVHLTCH